MLTLIIVWFIIKAISKERFGTESSIISNPTEIEIVGDTEIIDVHTIPK